MVIGVDVSPKQIELLTTIVPGLNRIAFLSNPGNVTMVPVSKALHAAAKTAGVEITTVEARAPDDIERGFERMVQERIRGLVVPAEAFYFTQRRQIGTLALKSRIAAVFQFREHLLADGLVSHGQDLAYTYQRTATYVDRILKGAKPSEIPVEQPSKIHLAINLKTAKALGLTISKELQSRADELIE